MSDFLNKYLTTTTVCFSAIPFTEKKQLRQRQDKEERKASAPSVPGALDVQALMDKAIEMRRKVIEISDSGGDESDDDDDDWWWGLW